MQGRKYFCRIVLKTLVEGHLEEMENTESAAVELVVFLEEEHQRNMHKGLD